MLQLRLLELFDRLEQPTQVFDWIFGRLGKSFSTV
ncbi:unnamed protein product [Rodentolepis nana]|uniref:IS4 family transposase n=1 Tax=Rodentolepis nana TaxID=102285 RepID=A0A0R3TCQ4_RODNA|nr:unnamed protein product [Rodentolepis nana]